MTLESPLVCHAHSLLIYPTINKELRKEWDGQFTRLHHGWLTQKGYNKAVRNLLQRAGILRKKPAMRLKTANQQTEPAFQSLTECERSNRELRAELGKLQSQDAHSSHATKVEAEVEIARSSTAIP